MQLSYESRGVPRSHRVLVADDYPDTADVVCVLLSILGHDCRAVRTGQEALDEARTFQPDIAIVDIGLPDMSGVDVGRELRRMSARRPFHLAAITGWTDAELRRRTHAAGFDQHVIKPTDLAKLTSIVRCAERARSALAAEQFVQP